MALNGRTRIAIVVAGIAGAAGLAAGGTALADPGGGGRVELQIVGDETPGGGAGTDATGGTGADADGHDCPGRGGGAGSGGQAADTR
ncbi:hypothetical protein ACGFNU_17250 [Spirillospora sp. NPDC048911]|uniref:hypothetical protein n=1 Tax=Spirillospora sp. NPDC048911 TaxID=3364527 RepID=UPI003710BF5D